MKKLILAIALLSPFVVQAQVANQMVTLSSNGNFLFNSITGRPVFITGEDGFLSDLQISTTDLTTYLNDRASRGYNAIWVGFTDQVDQSTPPKDFLGNLPFTSGGVSPNNWFGTLNSTYWTRLDALVSQASALGITVFIHPSFIGNCCADGDSASWLAASAGIIQNYGIAIGTRYASANNVVYVLGGDYDSSNATIRTNLTTFAVALRSADPNHLITLEACRAGTCAFPNSQDTTQSYGGAGSVPSYIGMNWAYAVQSSVVAACQAAFTNSTGHSFPPVMGEDWYELEHSLTGTATRIEGYQEILSGCYTGRLFGNGPIWSFNSPNGGSTTPTWQSQLASAGSLGQQLMGQLFRTREHWLMVPDVGHTYLTAGYGSGLTLSVLSRTSDGQTMIAYVPNGNATTISVNMAGITSASSTVNEWWYNPQSSATTHIGTHANSGTATFTPPDGNDWVLVLDDNSANLPPPGVAPGSYTAASCNLSDVQAVIQGPNHVAVDGDTINIPAGKCTWSTNGASAITVSGIGITVIGAGLVAPASCSATGPGTCITLTEVSNVTMLSFSPTFGNSTTRISGITWIPSVPFCTGPSSGCGNGGGVNGPFSVNGTCTLSGCPNLRFDNNYIPSAWANNGISDDSVLNVTNMFGVADHNTVGDTAPGSNGVVLANIGHGVWQGISAYGDNSYATADTFGTNQAFYLEDNTFGTTSGAAVGTDTDVNGVNGGGGRLVCRFNTFNNISSGGACTGHGTDTTNRTRGVRQWEGYWNTLICQNTMQGCGSAWPGRSGVGMSFANIFSNGAVGSFVKGIAAIDTQRRWRGNTPFGFADGTQPWDTNDNTSGACGTGCFYTGTIATAATGGPGWTVTVSGSPWTASQWVSNGTPYSIWDVSKSGGAEIQSNGTNSLALIVPDTGHGASFASGDTFQIRRVLVAMDQSARGAGVLLNGNQTSPTPVGPVNQALDPIYEADDTMPSTASSTIGANTASIIPNRDLFVETVRQAANGSCGGVSCTPFNGTGGSGHGLFSNKPNCTSGPACLTGVGYWATDCPGASGCSGTSWNTSTGANAGKIGELFTWNGSAWVLKYEPYTYPHPLVTGVGVVSVAPLSENFGSIVVGSSSATQAATLTNGTAAGITITSVTYTGNTADFPQTANTCSGTIAANGGTCAVTNNFSPTSTGARSATLTIATSAGSFPVALSGTGTSPVNPGVNINPASIAFGNVTVGFPTPGTTVTITSTTSANLVMGNPPAIISGAGFSLQAIGGQCTANQSIPMNSTCVESVVFNPSATGPASGQLSIFDNVTGSPQIVTLTGTGVGNISLNPASMNFGLIAQGQTSPSQLLTVTNNTGVTLTLTGVSFTNLDFAATSNTCNSGMLTSGMSCTMNITFRPSATTGTNETGMVQISYTGVGMSPVVIDLAGTVLPPIGTPATNIFAKNLAACGGIPKLTTFCMTQDGHIYVGVCNPTCTAFKPMAFTVTGVAQ